MRQVKTRITGIELMMQSIITMLNAMLDINQIEAGIVRAMVTSVDVGALLGRLKKKFADQAASRDLDFRVVPCGLSIVTNGALLEQMLTNLVGNALIYTNTERVLLGCRRHSAAFLIVVWDSGIGIAADQL